MLASRCRFQVQFASIHSTHFPRTLFPHLKNNSINLGISSHFPFPLSPLPEISTTRTDTQKTSPLPPPRTVDVCVGGGCKRDELDTLPRPCQGNWNLPLSRPSPPSSSPRLARHTPPPKQPHPGCVCIPPPPPLPSVSTTTPKKKIVHKVQKKRKGMGRRDEKSVLCCVVCVYPVFGSHFLSFPFRKRQPSVSPPPPRYILVVSTHTNYRSPARRG